jgi:hypothetical protein
MGASTARPSSVSGPTRKGSRSLSGQLGGERSIIDAQVFDAQVFGTQVFGTQVFGTQVFEAKVFEAKESEGRTPSAGSRRAGGPRAEGALRRRAPYTAIDARLESGEALPYDGNRIEASN